jgi:hypothetical protein
MPCMSDWEGWGTNVCTVNFVLVTTNIDLGYKLELKLKFINFTIIV